MGRSATRRASAAHLLAAGVVEEVEVVVVMMVATGQGQAIQDPTRVTAYATTQMGLFRLLGGSRHGMMVERPPSGGAQAASPRTTG
jgi:hypothetical protein